jgi:hypothetical protein
MTASLSDYIPSCVEHEKLFISYILKENSAIIKLPYEYLTDYYCKEFYKSILKIKEDQLILTQDLLEEFCKKNIVEFDINIFNDFFTEKDFSNIDYSIFKVKENFFKRELAEDLNKVVGEFIISKKDVNINSVKKLISSVNENLLGMESDKQLLTTEDIGRDYRTILLNRKKGTIKRSLGSPELDKKLIRPANAGEMNLLLGMKGGLKSTIALNWENYLINSGICVLSFNPEMEAETNYDRLVSMRSSIDIEDLVSAEKDRRLEGRIENTLQGLEDNPYYLYNSDADLDFNKVDSLISKAKQIFKERGVLPEDEYIWTKFDTFDMLSEFDGADPKRIKANVNIFHRLIRRQRIFALLLMQANENKIRGEIKFKKPEDLDWYKLGKEDIEGGAAYASKARVVLAINRPNYLKKEFFPEQMEEWNLEPDIINIHSAKLNDGNPFFLQFVRGDCYRIEPYKPDKGVQE